MSVAGRTAACLFLIITMSSCKPEDNARTALDEAQGLADKGDYAGALEKHVWFHDHALEANPALYGVRLSFALSYWIELGKKYPPALQTLKKIRDQKTARIIGGEDNREVFHDVVAINEYLVETQATSELFKGIDNSNPQFASKVADLADKALIQSKDYALARKYLGDPMAHLATAKRNFGEGIEFANSSAKHPATTREVTTNLFVEHVMEIITVLRETGDKELARKVQTEALKTTDNPTIRDSLQ
jgi:hypothetical protein